MLNINYLILFKKKEEIVSVKIIYVRVNITQLV